MPIVFNYKNKNKISFSPRKAILTFKSIVEFLVKQKIAVDISFIKLAIESVNNIRH